GSAGRGMGIAAMGDRLSGLERGATILLMIAILAILEWMDGLRTEEATTLSRSQGCKTIR
ncbi:MAG: hypothetical protein KDK97_20690, partial [Verrucomicrobiales bacterium]|nr:hypothetical protein [Verrucomicrobiales bacterium]